MSSDIINIVIIGGDNSGKTTLANNLNNRFKNSRVIHSPGKDLTSDEMVEFMEKSTSECGINIFDRFPLIEESINGPILRGVNKLDDVSNDVKKEILNKIDIWILCFPGFEKILNWGNREQMDGIKENCVELYSKYILAGGNLAEMFPDKYLDYNFQADYDAEIIFNKINNRIVMLGGAV